MLTALQRFQKNYERPSSTSGGKKQLCKHECLKIISPPPTMHTHTHTHTHIKFQHNIRLKLKHCNYGDGRLISTTICSVSTYHTGSTVFCPCLKHISNSVFEVINRCSAASCSVVSTSSNYLPFQEFTFTEHKKSLGVISNRMEACLACRMLHCDKSCHTRDSNF